MATITILNQEFPNVDFNDYEVSKAYEQAMSMLKAWESPANGSRTEEIKAYCELINRCLNVVLGEDAAERLFGGKLNLKLATEAMIQLVKAQRASDAEVNTMINEINREAQGNKNREQRRAEAQGKHKGKKGKKQRYQQPVLNLPMDEG
ncbi:MAG: hypothetical protein LUH03_09965 [Oscillospiraceae bacterium]|nr:hypothetical protein [Oscillospiraceae bacterium]